MNKERKVLFAVLLALVLSAYLVSALPFTSEDVKNSPITKAVTFYLFGLRDISSLPSPWDYWTILIIFLMIWLILAAAFADILVVFSPFRRRTSILLGLALTILAANLKVVQILATYLISVVAIFGTISIFIGIIAAFVAFLAISLGFEPLATWALERKARMHAHRGRLDIAEGINVFAQAGRRARRAGREAQEGGHGFMGQGYGGGI